jgi:O-antigen/teichoic acid export membrane protein
LKLLQNFGPVITAEMISGFLGGIFWLIIASFLAVKDFGELQFWINISGMAVGITLIANNNSMLVYEVKKIDLRATLFLISFLIAGIISLILFIIYSRMDIIFLTLGMMIGEMMIGIILGKKLFKKYFFYIVLQKILMVILGIVFYYYFGISGIIYGIALSYVPLSEVIFKGFKESKIDFSLFKSNFGFIINNYWTRVILFSRKHLDKIIIVPILGFDALGEYALAFQIYMVMILFSSISFKFLLVNDSSGITSKKLQGIVLFTSIIISMIGIIIVPKIIPIFFPKFIEVISIIPILSVAVIPNSLAVIFTSKFLANEKSKIPLIGTIIQVGAYLSLVITLGSIYGLIGMSFGFLISSIFYALFLIIMYKKEG